MISYGMISSSCGIAFKEWAAVCEALAAGRQTLILRKGGLQEGHGGFRVAHREFWLYPTQFHQSADALIPEAAEFAARAAATAPTDGTTSLSYFAAVEEVHEIADERGAIRLAGLHVWSEATVRQRFHYRRPGLFLLVVRLYARGAPWVITETPEMAGCKSWAILPSPLSTAGLAPVIGDTEFAARVAAIHAAL